MIKCFAPNNKKSKKDGTEGTGKIIVIYLERLSDDFREA